LCRAHPPPSPRMLSGRRGSGTRANGNQPASARSPTGFFTGSWFVLRTVEAPPQIWGQVLPPSLRTFSLRTERPRGVVLGFPFGSRLYPHWMPLSAPIFRGVLPPTVEHRHLGTTGDFYGHGGPYCENALLPPTHPPLVTLGAAPVKNFPHGPARTSK